MRSSHLAQLAEDVPTPAVRLLLERSHDLSRRADAGDARQDLLDREPMHLRVHARARVLGDHDGVAVLPRVSRGTFDAEVGGDAGEDDRVDAAASELKVELRAVECTQLAFRDDDGSVERGDVGDEVKPVGGDSAGWDGAGRVGGLGEAVGAVGRKRDVDGDDQGVALGEGASELDGSCDDV